MLLLFLAFLFSVLTVLALLLLEIHRHRLAHWVLVLGMALMTAQQWSQVLSITATMSVSNSGPGLAYWPGILVLAAGTILDSWLWVRLLFVGVGLLGIALPLFRFS